MAANLPALQVVLPLVAAPICVIFRRATAPWLLATAISWAALLVALAILLQVAETGLWSYEVGGWPAPWGIEIRIDLANAFVLLIITVISAIVMPYARHSVAAEISEDKAPLFYSMYLLCFCGLLGITVTGDAFNLFVFLEISSLSSYVLIAMGKDRRAVTAAYQYLIMGTIGATFYLIGVGLLYHVTGTLNMADLAARIEPIEELRTVHAAFAFLIIGLAIKAAIFPLHMWLPNAYCYAPSVVTAFLAATATKVSIYVLIRVTTSVFTPQFSFDVVDVGYVLAPLALIAMLVASTIAIFQTNVKRLLAYSSVAQIGYMILGVSLGTVAGLTAGLVHLFNHAMIKGGLFLALGCIFLRVGAISINNMIGLGRVMPWTMAAFVLGGLSLIGVPLTTGFISKWLLIQASLELGLWIFAVLIVVSSILAIVYVWRIVELAYFRDRAEPAEGEPKVTEAPPIMLIPTWLLILANVYFGIDTDLTVGVAQRAAEVLMGGAP
ncbi:MAG: monovalent cation/H+ antiporter subunit D family protein [Pseudomonadota bacterium]